MPKHSKRKRCPHHGPCCSKKTPLSGCGFWDDAGDFFTGVGKGIASVGETIYDHVLKPAVGALKESKILSSIAAPLIMLPTSLLTLGVGAPEGAIAGIAAAGALRSIGFGRYKRKKLRVNRKQQLVRGCGLVSMEPRLYPQPFPKMRNPVAIHNQMVISAPPILSSDVSKQGFGRVRPGW